MDAAAQDNSDFFRPHVLSAQCIIGTEKYPETGINTDYAKNKKSQAYGELLSFFKHLSKANILQPYISKDDFWRYDNFKFYVFDIPHQKHFSRPQIVEIVFRFSSEAAHAISAGTIGYALV